MTVPQGNSLRSRQVQSLIFLSWVFLTTEKAYSSLTSFPRLNNLELILFMNTLLLHGLNPRPSLYNMSAKNHLNCLQTSCSKACAMNYLPFHWVFFAIFGCGNIFDQRLLSDHTLICIWPLELSEHYEPGNHTKNQRLKPLRNSLNVSRAKFDVRDFWTCRWRPSLLFKFFKKMSCKRARLLSSHPRPFFIHSFPRLRHERQLWGLVTYFPVALGLGY